MEEITDIPLRISPEVSRTAPLFQPNTKDEHGNLRDLVFNIQIWTSISYLWTAPSQSTSDPALVFSSVN